MGKCPYNHFLKTWFDTWINSLFWWKWIINYFSHILYFIKVIKFIHEIWLLTRWAFLAYHFFEKLLCSALPFYPPPPTPLPTSSHSASRQTCSWAHNSCCVATPQLICYIRTASAVCFVSRESKYFQSVQKLVICKSDDVSEKFKQRFIRSFPCNCKHCYQRHSTARPCFTRRRVVLWYCEAKTMDYILRDFFWGRQ